MTCAQHFITKEMVEIGLHTEIIQPKLDCGELTAHIGSQWFYFGGHEFENTDPAEIDFDTLASEIYTTLEAFREDWEDYEDEYLYYYWHLVEQTDQLCKSIIETYYKDADSETYWYVEPDKKQVVIADRHLTTCVLYKDAHHCCAAHVVPAIRDTYGTDDGGIVGLEQDYTAGKIAYITAIAVKLD